MARLLDWPRDLGWTAREPVGGPRSVASGSSESISGWVQTFAAPFGLWRWHFFLPPLRGAQMTAYTGLVTALHAGANAVRMPFCAPDGLDLASSGVASPLAQFKNGAPWANNQPWQNGKNWHSSRPSVAIKSPSAVRSSLIHLKDEAWGSRLRVGDMVGFSPFHFGLYVVTEAFGDGQYRIWPPLRKELKTTDVARLDAVLAMRLESASAAPLGRDAAMSTNLTLTLVEVEDQDVRNFYTE